MGRNLLGYADKLWAPYYEFGYTGNTEEFTLPAGEYLLECNGAPGGKTSTYTEPLYGGTSYGILNLSEPKTLYATVGGIGGDANDDNVTVGVGGWNGGADGGKSYHNEYPTGAGGGGASDIRVDNRELIYVPHEYEYNTDRFKILDYVISDGTGVVMTGYNHNKNTVLEIDCEILDPTEYTTGQNAYIFGSQFGNLSGCYSLGYRSQSTNVMSYALNGTSVDGSAPVFGQRLKIRVSSSKAEWFNENGEKLGEIENSDTHESFIDQLILFGKKSGTGTSYTISDQGRIKFYSLKVMEYNDTIAYYIPAKTKMCDITADIKNISWEQGSINGSGTNTSSSTRVRTPGYIDWSSSKIPRRVKVYAADTNGNPLNYGPMQYDSNNGVVFEDSWYSSGTVYTVYGNCEKVRFVLCRPGGGSINPSNVGYIHFEYVEDEVGLYNIFTDSFAQGVVKGEKPASDTMHLEAGNEISDTSVTLSRGLHVGLASRIIVAGGGGGQSWNEENGTNGTPAVGFGGGEYGGSPTINGNGVFKYPTQSKGYSFGTGENPPPRTSNSAGSREGAGGGGGGWYGGYASFSTNIAGCSVNGGGGSSYVLTDTSHIPFPEIYQPSSDFQLSNTSMISGTSSIPKIIVYKETTYTATDDMITFPCVGKMEHIKLLPGAYEFICYGGDGGTRYRHFTNTTFSRGGLSKGKFKTRSKRDVFVSVGGSGNLSNIISTTWSSKHIPTISFNGGGQAPDTSIYSSAGGGGSDIRIDSDSLYSRIIVAGGAGSQGYDSSYGGNGGGLEGEIPKTTNCGTTPGPGTQTGSPSYSSQPTICGGFGYGGRGIYRSSGYGGAGGGGWYGGSGTYPDGSRDDDTGGCGGSGYVFTRESYKPTGYLITNPEDYLTETTLTTQGNDLPRGNTMIKIRVIYNNQKMLCSNENLTSFYKFDASELEWVEFKSSLPTDEEFSEYGIYEMITDVGLPDQYKIIMQTPHPSIALHDVSLNVVPPEQTIKTTLHDDMPIGNSIIDFDAYHPSAYNIRMENSRKITDEETIIEFRLKINKKENDIHKPKIYLTDVYSV